MCPKRGPGIPRGAFGITEPVRRSERVDRTSRPAKASSIRIGCSRTQGRFTAPHNVCGDGRLCAPGSVICPMWGPSECRSVTPVQNKTKQNMQFREKFACARALVRACMEIDERDEKKRELRTRNERVRLLARPALRGKQEDFPLSCTRARACGALP